MAGSAASIRIRVASDLKAQADRLFGELGMNLTAAFNTFARHLFVKDGSPLRFPPISPAAKRLPLCWRQKGLRKIRQ